MKIVTPTWKTLDSVFGGRVKWIVISSPWFSAEGITNLGRLLPDEKVKAINGMEIWFRMNVEDHILGMADYEGLLDFAERIHAQLGDRLRLYESDGLHAKVYASDRKVLIASANLTKNGFEGNVEIGVLEALSAPDKDSLKCVLDKQRKRLNEVSISRLRTFVDRLKSEAVRNARQQVSRTLTRSRKELSLELLEEKSPHSKFPLR